MREIKFRVFDKNNNKMAFGGAFHTLEIDGDLQEWFGLPTPHPDDCELMQYTGLHDKNGNEIFEGDYLDEEGEEVIWCEKCGGWQTKWNYEGENICHNCDGDYSLAEQMRDGIVPVVVGNKYEKKEKAE